MSTRACHSGEWTIILACHKQKNTKLNKQTNKHISPLSPNGKTCRLPKFVVQGYRSAITWLRTCQSFLPHLIGEGQFPKRTFPAKKAKTIYQYTRNDAFCTLLLVLLYVLTFFRWHFVPWHFVALTFCRRHFVGWHFVRWHFVVHPIILSNSINVIDKCSNQTSHVRPIA